jgi:hypothetical protein
VARVELMMGIRGDENGPHSQDGAHGRRLVQYEGDALRWRSHETGTEDRSSLHHTSSSLKADRMAC